jgi:ABC-2 type transport system permease protein
MTAATMALPPGRYRLREVLRSEWTKLSTVRSTLWTLAVTIVLGVGLGAVAAATSAARWKTMSFIEQASFDPTRVSLTGILLAQLAVGVLGVLVVSAEYGTGTIRATFAAVPRRRLVLLAKTIVFGAVALLCGEVVSFAAFFIGQALLTSPAPHALLSQPGVARSVVGGGLYLAVLGLLALGIAATIRHTAGAISTFVGILLILPLIDAALPSSIGGPIGRYLPANIGVSLVSARVPSGVFGPWTSLGILCGYSAAVLVLGALVMARRDA